MSGKYGDLLNKAKQASQKDVKPEKQKDVKPESQEEEKLEKMVNVGAKVSVSHRNHWAAEAKRNGRSMTDVITSALIEAFGLPEE